MMFFYLPKIINKYTKYELSHSKIITFRFFINNACLKDRHAKKICGRFPKFASIMKRLIFFLSFTVSISLNAQAKKTSAASARSKTSAAKTSAKQGMPTAKSQDLAKINDSVPALLPFKENGKMGFKNQSGKIIIPNTYSNVGFFYEDCTLLHSPREQARKYGSGEYASVRDAAGDYRIDKNGKKVYKFKDEDLGKCPAEFKKQKYHAYVKAGFYGLIEDEIFKDESDYRQYSIYPQFQYLHVLEGDDLENPMIIAAYKDRFGVIDKHGKIIIPFEYEDIKRNYSWKIARLFEVTKDNKNYFFVDASNRILGK